MDGNITRPLSTYRPFVSPLQQATFGNIMANEETARYIYLYGELTAASERVKFANFLKRISSELACLIPIYCSRNVYLITLYKYNNIDWLLNV